LVFLASLLAACSAFPAGGSTPLPAATLTPAITAAAPETTALPPTASVTPSGPAVLRLWVPPQFDPDSGTPAGDLLKARLNQFTKRRPGVRLEVRLKAVDGPGGLLDSLSAASAAAPLALPDLVALPRDLMESAALKGLLHAYNNHTQVMDNPDWYVYAHQLAYLQNGVLDHHSIFGLPFAGDALALVYRPEILAAPPPDWPATLQIDLPLLFPAADEQALFTLALYQASGGAVQDEQGRPYLDAAVLSQVFTLYMEAEQNGVMPYWLTQYQNDEQAWNAFLEQRVNLVVTWASRYLRELRPDAALAPLPTAQGQPFTLATGWVWALTTPGDGKLELSVELAEFLVDRSFLASWTEAAGYLPPHPDALNAWLNAPLGATLVPLVISARLCPPTDVLTVLGIPLEQATVQVLKKQSDPLSAAQSVVKSLASP
jgi:maltose-binding protein MalE